jgi:hypothetical protein
MAGPDDTSHAIIITGNSFIGGITQQLEMCGTRGSVVVGNTFYDQAHTDYYAIDMQGDAGGSHHLTHNIVMGNTFYNCYNGIRLYAPGDGSYGCQYNIVAMNNFMRSAAKGINWCINITASVNNLGNEILFNNLGTAANSLTDGGTGTIIQGNIGINYKAENSGVTGVIADGDPVSHGLSAAPTKVWVQASVAGEFATVPSATITTAHFHVDIKKHDGSGGTSQVIYWRAEV